MIHGKKNPSYCLVLSGGGAKGVYHIGAWKALTELGIPVKAFIGNSIGAVMAGFLAQGKYRELEKIGDTIGIDFIMKVPEELVVNGELKIGKSQLPAFRRFYHSVIQKKGIDITPFRNLVYKNLDEEEIRHSGNDLGVVTFNVSDMHPVKTYLDEMEEGEVLEYLLASAAFPGMEQTEIRGKKYIDGGVWDNMPYDMARTRGYRNIIVLDISGMGINRRPEIEGTNTIYIKNSINMGGVFDFNREFLDQYKKLGYLDTMKTFGRLKGYDYFFEPRVKMEKKLIKKLEDDRVRIYLEGFISSRKVLPDHMGIDWPVRQILPENMQKNRELLYSLADCTASVFSLERVRCYTIPVMMKTARERQSLVEDKIRALKRTISQKEKRQLMTKLTLFFREAGHPEEELESPYYYYRLLQDVLEQEDSSLLMKALLSRYPELKGGVLFLNILGEEI